MRIPSSNNAVNGAHSASYGLNNSSAVKAVEFVYSTLDGIDEKLVASGSERLSEMIELANLSAVIGNLLRTGVANNSNGTFAPNGPHQFPDLLSQNPDVPDLEIKVALETNKPKGHLPKPGNHLICRYVLCDEQGRFTRGKENRGAVVWIWELRLGNLEIEDFNCSNTPGDSGKTAVINAAGMEKLVPIYCDLERCPYPPTGRVYGGYADLFSGS